MDRLQLYKPLIDATLEKWIPRAVDQQNLPTLFGPASYEYDLEVLNRTLFTPMWDLLERGTIGESGLMKLGGKRWRSLLLILIAQALGKSAEDIIDFVTLIEILHNGSLIIDDVEDRSEYRRGKPCIHKITGEDVAINLGNCKTLPLDFFC